jgi:hypothetical protein
MLFVENYGAWQVTALDHIKLGRDCLIRVTNVWPRAILCAQEICGGLGVIGFI